jgi:hypothetical protein
MKLGWKFLEELKMKSAISVVRETKDEKMSRKILIFNKSYFLSFFAAWIFLYHTCSVLSLRKTMF